jgi:hypothetical protein
MLCSVHRSKEALQVVRTECMHIPTGLSRSTSSKASALDIDSSSGRSCSRHPKGHSTCCLDVGQLNLTLSIENAPGGSSC